jgi:hypothetical protein
MTFNEMKTEDKKVVLYRGPATFTEYLHCDEENQCIYVGKLIEVMDHPRLGHCWDVRTSRIVRFPNEQGTFETLNTVYKKDPEDDY